MTPPPKDKTIVPSGFKWEAKAVYRVRVAYRPTNPIHDALLHVGFLKEDGTPGANSEIWQNSYGEVFTFSSAHYLEVVEKLCVLP